MEGSSCAQFSNALQAVNLRKTNSIFVGISGRSEIWHET